MVPHRTENCVSSAEVSGSWPGCPSPCPRPHCHGHGLIWRPLSHCEWLRICLGSGPRPHLSHSPTLSSNPNPAATSQVGVCRRRPQEAVRTPIPRQERRLCPAGCWSLFPGSLLSPPPPQSWRREGFSGGPSFHLTQEGLTAGQTPLLGLQVVSRETARPTCCLSPYRLALPLRTMPLALSEPCPSQLRPQAT